MGKNKQQRRADLKRRAAQARKAGHAAGGRVGGFMAGSSPPDHVDVERLLDAAASLAASVAGDDPRLEQLIAVLVDIDGAAGATRRAERPEPLLARLLVDRLAVLWEAGWQPLDLVHVVRRLASPKVGRLAAAAIRHEAAEAPHRDLMPQEWSEQLESLGALASRDETNALFDVWKRSERVGVADALLDGLRLFGLIRVLAPIAQLCAPPSRWSRQPTSSATPAGAVTQAAPDKALATIRALLAKAEGTTFPAEAEAFAAKAQEMMTRYAIDAAMLEDRSGTNLAAGVRSRRIHIDQPYAKEKVQLLATVGVVNRVRVVFQEAYSMATVVGFPADLDITDMLFTSLLVQASRSLSDATKAIGRGSSPAFRRGFWLAYAVRVGERLEEANRVASGEAESSYGAALVPILAARSEAVASVVNQLFARTMPMKARSVDAQGWHAGRTAAILASLHAPQTRLTG